MAFHDIIPDMHGQIGGLQALVDCLDYPAGTGDDPLLGYRWEPGAPGPVLEAIVGAGADAGRAAAAGQG